MHRSTIARHAAVFALAALAACETPTTSPITPDAGGAQPAYNLAVAQMTVTDSNGTPLVSWNQVSGATGYTVRLITYFTEDGAYKRRIFQTLATTTGTSFLDTNNTYTGIYQCTDGYEGPDGVVRGNWYEYEVVTHFPTGTSSARHYAPITYEYC